MSTSKSIPPLFPKPHQIKNPPIAVRVYRDGREECNLNCKAGHDEYESRKRKMWERQDKVCCLAGVCPTCPGKLRWADTTFDHEHGRGHGGGKRDDRIEKGGKWLNGACHFQCNAWKASRQVRYSTGEGGLGI